MGKTSGWQSYKNYGQWCSDEVHRRNAERKAWKDEQKAYRYYDRGYPRYSYQPRNYTYYENNSYDYRYRSPRQERAERLRSLIANVLGSNDYLSGAQPLYYGDRGLPFGNYSDLIGGGGFVQQLLGNLLAVGYEQGYLQGQNARRAGYGTRYYYDPYNSGTNYLSSVSLGENRSCLSDGYELGYNDALYNRGGSVLDQDTNVDLVSLLLGNALQVL